MRLLIALVSISLLSPCSFARADEPSVPPLRQLYVRIWDGGDLVSFVVMELVPGRPGVFETGDPGAPVPEGMAPPPLKLTSVIAVQSLEGEAQPDPEWMARYTEPLAVAQRFEFGGVELLIYATQAERFDAFIFDPGAPPQEAVALPGAFPPIERNPQFGPLGIPVSWLGGSLKAAPVIYISSTPQPASVTLRGD